MALMGDPLGRARRCRSEAEAKRLFGQLDVELARDDDELPASWKADAEAAQQLLMERFLSEPSSSPAADPKPKPTPKGGGKARRGGGRGPKPSGRHNAGGARRPGGRTNGRRSRSSTGARVGRSVLDSVPTGGAGAIVMSALGGTLLLVLVYVLLRSSEHSPRRSALDMMATGLVSGLQMLMAPVDPLAPRSQRAQAAFANEVRVAHALGGTKVQAAPRASAHRAAHRRPTHSPSP